MNVERLRRSFLLVPASDARRMSASEADGHFVDAARVRIARRVVRQAELAKATRVGSRA